MTTALRQSGGLLRSVLQWVGDRTRRTEPDRRTPSRQHKKVTPNAVHVRTQPGLDRQSETWRDAVGPGFAIGVTQSVIDLMNQDSMG